MPVQMVCDWCDKLFFKSPSQTKYEHNFCSDICKKNWEFAIKPFISVDIYNMKVHPIVCVVCGGVRYATAAEARRSKSCSRACAYKFKAAEKLGVDGTGCPSCGKRIYHKKSYRMKHAIRFCSRECMAKYYVKRLKITCQHCGREVEKLPYQVEQSNHHFCSRRCFEMFNSGQNHPFWKGGYSNYYGPNWLRQRERAVIRDKVCRLCGEDEKLHVHHISPYKGFGIARYIEANKLLNLITLCGPCHRKVHSSEEIVDEFLYSIINEYQQESGEEILT